MKYIMNDLCICKSSQIFKKKKMKILLLFLFFTVAFCYNNTFIKRWKPKELASYSMNYLVDTNSYIEKSNSSYDNIKEYCDEIYEKKKFDVYIYFIDSISDDYIDKASKENRKNIEQFTYDLAYERLKGNVEKEKNSMFVVFSVEDKQDRIHTGENIRKIIKDDTAHDLLDQIVESLRKGSYTIALEQLIYSIKLEIIPAPLIFRIMKTLLSIIIFLGFWLCCCCCFFVKRERVATRDFQLENQLEKMRKVSEINKNNPNFLDDNCIICLEQFTEEQKNSVRKKENHTSNSNSNNKNKNKNDSNTDNANNRKESIEKHNDTCQESSVKLEVKTLLQRQGNNDIIEIKDEEEQKLLMTKTDNKDKEPTKLDVELGKYF